MEKTVVIFLLLDFDFLREFHSIEISKYTYANFYFKIIFDLG
jgi:hypothetical protein